MGAALPEISPATFSTRLLAATETALEPALVSKLYRHYQELRRWNPSVSLIGPGTRDTVVERHYGESLAAQPLLPASAMTLLDIGSGAGFPGLVLAAQRPGLAVTLVEARARKCAFLLAAARAMALPVTCLNARLTTPLPPGLPGSIDVVTVRAVRIETGLLEPLLPLLSPHARVLLWCGADAGDLPAPLIVVSECALSGSTRILVLGMRGNS